MNLRRLTPKEKDETNILKDCPKVLRPVGYVEIPMFWNNKNICITGTGIKSRKDLAANLQERGANVTPTVSVLTSFLIVGKNPGSKLNKARKLKIPLLLMSEAIKDLYGHS